MSTRPSLIVIPALASHREVLASSIPRLQRLFQARPILVTPQPESLAPLASLGVEIAADRDYLTLNKDQIRDRLGEQQRVLAGWYFQQLLKYEIVLKSRAEWILILDADTVLLSVPPAPDVQPLAFPASGENHAPYFRTFTRLTGLPRRLARSAIVNYMWFSAAELSRLVRRIEEHCQLDWREAILRAAAAEQAAGSYSEYETYANWIAHQIENVRQTPWRLFRRGDLLLSGFDGVEAVVSAAERRCYDAVAFENSHQATWCWRLVARPLFAMGLCTNLRRYV